MTTPSKRKELPLATKKDIIAALNNGEGPRPTARKFKCSVGSVQYAEKNQDKIMGINNALEMSKFTHVYKHL